MENEIYQKAAEALVKYLPDGWEKVALRAEISEELSSVCFFVYLNNEYVYNLDLPEKYGISEEFLDGINDDFYEIFLPDQQEKNWYAMKFYLKNTGEFNVEYDYERPENIITYEGAWIKRHREANTKKEDE